MLSRWRMVTNFKVGPLQSQGETQFLYLAWMESSPKLVTVFPEPVTPATFVFAPPAEGHRDMNKDYQPEGTTPSVPHSSENLSTCPRRLDKCKACFPSLPAVRLLSSQLVILLQFHFHLLPTQSSLIITGQGHWLLFTFLFILLVTAAWKDISLGPPSNQHAWHPFLFWLWAGHPWASSLPALALEPSSGPGLWWGRHGLSITSLGACFMVGVVEDPCHMSLHPISQVIPMTNTRRKVLVSSL